MVVDDELIVRLHDEVERLARQGLRILAVARRAAPDLIERLTTANRTSSGPDPGLDDGGQLDDADIDHLELLGFLGLADPVRSSAAWAVAAVRRAGIEVTMITGDHPSTAEAIADELDILNGRRVVTGAELAELDDEDLDSILLDIAVFARITPDQKVRIVNAYQRLDMAIAMTGDGGNDAPAIRLADAGIALGRHAAAAAREAADVVVLDDRIETIVDAIIEGRAMWTSVRAALAILLGGNVGEVGFTLMGTLVSGEAPLNPRQLLLVNLLTDLVPALVLAVRSPDASSPEKLLGEGPERSLGGPLTREITVRAVSTASGATSAWWLARLTGTRTRARTVGLVGLVSAQLGQTVVAGGFSPTVIGSSAVSLAALAGIVQTPGLSQFFGSRPIGPVGWTIGLGAGVTATAGSVALGPLIEHLWLQLGRAPLDASAPERPRSSSITIS